MHWILALGVHGGLLTQLGTFDSYGQCATAANVVMKLLDGNKHPEMACLPDNDPEAALIIKPKS